MADGGVVRAPSYAAARLSALVQEHWAAFDGEAALAGVEVVDLRPDRFFNAVYAWAIQRVEDRDQFHALVFDPPEGAEVSEHVIQAEKSDFDAFAAAFGAG